MKPVKFVPALRFNFLTDIYDFVFRITMPENKFRNELVDLLPKEDSTTVLEFGTGTASNAILVKQKYPRVTVTGVDVDEKIVDIARKKIAKLNSPISLVQYDGQHLPLPDNHYDAVFSSLVFHHLTPADKLNAFAEIQRVLKPGGKFVYADWGKPTNIYNKISFRILGLFDGPLNTKDHISGHYHTMIMNAGFKQSTILKKYNTVFGTLELAETFKSSGL